MNTQLERNKQNVIAFYDLMFNQCQPLEAVRQFIGITYIQHNPHVADFLKNLAMAGGYLLFVRYGAGSPAIDDRVER